MVQGLAWVRQPIWSVAVLRWQIAAPDGDGRGGVQTEEGAGDEAVQVVPPVAAVRVPGGQVVATTIGNGRAADALNREAPGQTVGREGHAVRSDEDRLEALGEQPGLAVGAVSGEAERRGLREPELTDTAQRGREVLGNRPVGRDLDDGDQAEVAQTTADLLVGGAVAADGVLVQVVRPATEQRDGRVRVGVAEVDHPGGRPRHVLGQRQAAQAHQGGERVGRTGQVSAAESPLQAGGALPGGAGALEQAVPLVGQRATDVAGAVLDAPGEV